MKDIKKIKVRVEHVAKLKLYEPTTTENNIEEEIGLNPNFDQKINYGVSKRSDYLPTSSNHFTFLVDQDGALWADANRYLLSRALSFVPAKARTLQSIASDLKVFWQWLIDENVNYLLMPLRARARPTYKFCRHLHDQIQIDALEVSTAKRRMSSVQNFYRWLSESEGHHFEHAPWLEEDTRLFFNDKKGFQRTKAFKSTDLSKSFKNQKNSDDYGDFINDGGKLRPLPKDEQVALIQSLKTIGNIEMLLSFVFSLCTGARLQTVFTMRQCHFEKVMSDGETYFSLKVGRKTLIDTKNGKHIVLQVPIWLYERVQVYLRSERYKKRTAKANLQKNGEQYVFLTREGNPYYMSEKDVHSGDLIEPPRGNAVTQFIRQQLRPCLMKNNQTFDFKFHYLRATFGMNLLESNLSGFELSQIDNNQPLFFEVLMYVRERMGHSQLATTEGYLNYRKNYHIALNVQEKYENYLNSLFEKGIGL